MGYDVHITRAENWLNSQHHPVLESEWLGLVSADETLEVDALSYSGRDSADGTSKRQHPVIWLAHTDPQGDHPNFWYKDGRIFRKNPDDPTLKKMIEIAHKLDARVLGDEEEEYAVVEGKIQVRDWTDASSYPDPG